jgi:hypothetical protein
MREQLEPPSTPSRETLQRETVPHETLDDRMRQAPGLGPLLAEAESTWRARAAASGLDAVDAAKAGLPGWRTFEDAFPTFYEFTNRPR